LSIKKNIQLIKQQANEDFQLGLRRVNVGAQALKRSMMSESKWWASSEIPEKLLRQNYTYLVVKTCSSRRVCPPKHSSAGVVPQLLCFVCKTSCSRNRQKFCFFANAALHKETC